MKDYNGHYPGAAAVRACPRQTCLEDKMGLQQRPTLQAAAGNSCQKQHSMKRERKRNRKRTNTLVQLPPSKQFLGSSVGIAPFDLCYLDYNGTAEEDPLSLISSACRQHTQSSPAG
ncbi:hypothetical protein NQZ68_033018 [Dissostichus eleginoides]|nr:hypothetical protein NQZ68_033018 [Dissostichus eleginoides]